MTAFNSPKFCNINANPEPNSGHKHTHPKHLPPLPSPAATSHQKMSICFTSAKVREDRVREQQSVLQGHSTLKAVAAFLPPQAGLGLSAKSQTPEASEQVVEDPPR